MLKNLIAWSVHNRFLVLLATLVIAGWGWVALHKTPLDAIPDLSDVQVIIKTSYPGQAPRVVEEQVTYPITTTMLSVPGAQVVRGYSFFGDSYVYVIFADGTDLYWARARVLEYLNQAAADLPDGVQPRLGPDATGVGWVYNYALVDRTGRHDLAELRSLQDWFLKYELQTVPGVSEVATVGGMVRQYQVVVDPEKLRAFGITLAKVSAAIRAANREVGGSVLELAEAEYMVRTRGYLKGLTDLEQIPITVTEMGTPVLLRDVAHVQVGPEIRRVVADLDGEGEITGGIVVMRYGENALATIERVKTKLEQLRQGLPAGVEIVETYDRSALIKRAVTNLEDKLVEEFLVVAIVCLVFLFHLRSAFVAIVTLPLGILASFIVMQHQGINANIMSLGGIAIAIGAMVDAAIVMIENAHKHLERYRHAHGHAPQGSEHWQVITTAAAEVGPALFFSLLIITLSFLPVFTLEAQEGRLFAPLAFTKTYAMAAAAGLAVTLVPVLMGYFIRGRIPDERRNPLNALLIWLYRPALTAVMRVPRFTLLVAVLAVASLVIPVAGVSGFLAPLKWPFQIAEAITGEPRAEIARVEQLQDTLTRDWKRTFRDTPWLARFASGLGSEFMPELDEGDLMYMPTTLPGLSIGKAQELLQQTDRLIRKIPEVKRVFGKIGRADTATDPAPLTMIETVIQLQPRDRWRPGMTTQRVIEQLDATVKYPGVTNAWVMPIKTRIDMLSTGIKTPVGIKVGGPDLAVIQKIGKRLEEVLPQVQGTTSVYAERVAGGRYIKADIDRNRAARLGLNISDVQDVVRTAIGGMNVTETIEGLERYPVNLRYPRDWRNSVASLRQLPIVTTRGGHVTLGDVADVYIEDGPPMIKSEAAQLTGWTFIDIAGRDVGSYVEAAQQLVAAEVELPAGYSLTWSGQYEYIQKARQSLVVIVPVTLVMIALLLYMAFRSVAHTLIILGTLPMALAGSYWLLYLLDYNMSVAVAVGFIALAGVTTELGVVLMVYLNQAVGQYVESCDKDGEAVRFEGVRDAVRDGALLRLRPISMTVAAVVAGLLPVMFGTGTGSEVMRRIAAPMVGGMLSALILTMLVIPAVYLLWEWRRLRRTGKASLRSIEPS